MSRIRQLVLVGATVTGLAGCGSAAKQAAPPAESPGGAEPASGTPPAFEQPVGERDEKKRDAEKLGGEGEGAPALVGLDDAENALSQGESRLATALASAKDCVTARKALESMRRARERICDLQGPEDPGGRCTRASDQYDAARERVRRACDE